MSSTKSSAPGPKPACVAEWTRELIELALHRGGRYDLPYQLHASDDQFARAYPEADRLRLVKLAADPEGKFSNELWRRYFEFWLSVDWPGFTLRPPG